jgi:hypothetical protein
MRWWAPLEIGWAFADRATSKIRSGSHLIKPPSHWDLRSVWDSDAERLHKITRDEFYIHGRTPLEIADRMNKALAGRPSARSECPALDQLANERLLHDTSDARAPNS